MSACRAWALVPLSRCAASKYDELISTSAAFCDRSASSDGSICQQSSFPADMFGAGDVFPSHHWLGLVQSEAPFRRKLRLRFALVVFGCSIPASHCIKDGHDVWTMERIALFNNHSRNVIPDWAPQAYIDQSVNFANMLRRCL